MKKNIFTSLSLIAVLGICYFTFSSSSNGSNGVMGAHSTGCGSCHGNTANVSTVINFTGVPAAGFTAGTTYPVQLTVSNAGVNQKAAGFDLKVSAGTITNAPANTMLMGGTELHHTAPLDFVSGTATWNFSWTAPSSGNSVTVNVAANAVNKNGGDSGDQWNIATFNLNKEATSVKDYENNTLNLYPNPVDQFTYVKFNQAVSNPQIVAINATGSSIILNSEAMGNNEYKLNTSTLSVGFYHLICVEGSVMYKANLLKK